MKQVERWGLWSAVVLASVLLAVGLGRGQERGQTSYAPVDIREPFPSIMQRMVQAKAEVEKRQADLLSERYDLRNESAPGITMSRGKPVQQGTRVRLPAGLTWEALAILSPDDIRAKNVVPKGFYPLPHPNHPEGGMLFPKFALNELKQQEGRDLTRFDLDYDLPDHVLPEFPEPIYPTTRPDLGDVSQGKLVTIPNYYELFTQSTIPDDSSPLVLPFERARLVCAGIATFNALRHSGAAAAAKGA